MGEFPYPDGFHYEMDIAPEAAGSGIIGIFIVIYLLVMLFTMGVSVACYVLQSLSLHTIANRRRIRNGWLAWIPVAYLWILGSVSDQYQYVVKGKIKNRRKILLGLSIGTAVGVVLWFVSIVIAALASEGIIAGVAVMILFVFLGWGAVVGLSVANTVYQYICLYDLYCSCKPGNEVLFTVLSILFPVTIPLFMFIYRKKDLGMPPKKQPAEPVIEVVPEETAEETPTEEKEGVPSEETLETEPEEEFSQPEEE